jgi:hypothetical protein
MGNAALRYKFSRPGVVEGVVLALSTQCSLPRMEINITSVATTLEYVCPVFTAVAARKLGSRLQSNWVRICFIMDSCKTFFARSKRAFTHTHTLRLRTNMNSFYITEALIRAVQVDVTDSKCNIQNY